MALTDFDKYNESMKKFINSKLYSEKYQLLISILENSNTPIKSAYLENRLNISGAEVRKLIEHARMCGNPIASGGNGYQVARNSEGIESTIKHLEERITKMSIIKNILKGLFKPKEQQELF